MPIKKIQKGSYDAIWNILESMNNMNFKFEAAARTVVEKLAVVIYWRQCCGVKADRRKQRSWK
jgi:hypothetical protein